MNEVKLTRRQIAVRMGAGISLGVALGAALDHIALGLAIGMLVGGLSMYTSFSKVE